MAQHIIPFYGERRGAARVQSGADGLSLTLSLRPETGNTAELTAALIASAEGKTERIDLEKGQGSGETDMEIAVLLLCAAVQSGAERIVAEGVRAGFDRRKTGQLKEKLRALRRCGEKTEMSKRPAPAPEKELAAPSSALSAAEAAAPPAEAVPAPLPQSQALQEILRRAEALFPEGTEAAGHFASDHPFDAPFIPRPLAARERQRRQVPTARVRDDAWHDAVREMRKGGKLSGVGKPDGTADVYFPIDFPGTVFRRVRWPGSCRYYLEGRGSVEGKDALIYALPGEACGEMHFKGRGFQRFVRDKNGSGYWVKVRPIG